MGVTGLPVRQPRRAIIVALGYLATAALGGYALVLLGGIFLGGVLAIFWAAAWTVPLAVLLPSPEGRS